MGSRLGCAFVAWRQTYSILNGFINIRMWILTHARAHTHTHAHIHTHTHNTHTHTHKTHTRTHTHTRTCTIQQIRRQVLVSVRTCTGVLLPFQIADLRAGLSRADQQASWREDQLRQEIAALQNVRV